MEKRKQLFDALVEGRLFDLSALLQFEVDIDMIAGPEVELAYPGTIARGDTLVHVALSLKSQDALEILLRHGANLNVSAEDGVTPLQIAVGQGADELAIWFIDHGANFNSADMFGLTPIHYSSSCELILKILEKGVSPNLRAHSTGFTPLHYAAYHNQIDKMRFLLSRGSLPSSCGNNQETPMHLLMALPLRTVDSAAELLLDYGADINAKDEEGNTPLHWALGSHRPANWMDRGNISIVSFLLDRGSDARIRNKAGSSVLKLAWSTGDMKVRAIFEAKGFRPSIFEVLRLQ